MSAWRKSIIVFDESTDFTVPTITVSSDDKHGCYWIHIDSSEAKAAIAGQMKTGKLPETTSGWSWYCK